MKIIQHKFPGQYSILVQVSEKGYNEHLLVNEQPITALVFSMSETDCLRVERRQTEHFRQTLEGQRISNAEYQQRRKDFYKDFGVITVWEEGEEKEVSTQPDGLQQLEEFCLTTFPVKSAELVEEVEPIIIENVAKDLGSYITPLINASGLPEVAMYEYKRSALRSDYFNISKDVLHKYNTNISSSHPTNDWSIFFSLNGKTQMVKGEIYGNTVIGSESDVLRIREADQKIYDAKILDLESLFSPSKTNQIAISYLNQLRDCVDKLATLDVKSKSHKEWNNLISKFNNILSQIRKDSNVCSE